MRDKDLTIAVLGCGRHGYACHLRDAWLTPGRQLGKAIICGLLKQSDVSINSIEAAVNSDTSKVDLSKQLREGVRVSKGGNVKAANAADVVILACPPRAMTSILGEQGMDAALKGKPLVSVLAGVTTSAMEDVLKGGGDAPFCIFRALPNLAIATCASATAVEAPKSSIPREMVDVIDKLFRSLGGITYVPASNMNAATVMCGSTPAYVALFLDGMVDGAVAAGVPRDKARSMVAQMLSSTAALLQSHSPSELRESVCAMPGCTIQGNLVLEEGCIRGTSARAVKTAIDAASKLG
ncbi:Pyrroline-5-carboxylate [Cyphellophora attinorum]|uniref:Pyrroline-5-carboxylate n=1 Tax=Cyphellophora attinorum TaxID=1664694 RepID=A0A0N1H235_9EURO|nr:Pyrroline-5-carboxylate [Phialophora attinorum]KPI35153.1 Pyrroline-5-carboxylate [Phialophora attinorum]